MREFDALRGFSMFLVVIIHVFLCMDLPGDSTILGAFITSFYLSLFFFISGFFSYKEIARWNIVSLKSTLLQRFKALIICPLIFFALLAYTRGTNPLGWIGNGFMAYWFVEALFIIFICYIFCVAISKILRRDISLVLMTLLSVILLAVLMAHKVPQNSFIRTLNTANVCQAMQFFTAGLWAKKYKNKLLNILGNSYVKALLIVLFVVLLCARYDEWVINHEIIFKFITVIAIQYVGILLITTLFHAGSAYLNSNRASAKAICLIGRRTLDIYMIHYFFLPTLPMLKDFLSSNNMVLFQIFIVGGIAAMVVSMCLLVSNALRSSPLLADWLFGVRQTQKLTQFK